MKGTAGMRSNNILSPCKMVLFAPIDQFLHILVLCLAHPPSSHNIAQLSKVKILKRHGQWEDLEIPHRLESYTSRLGKQTTIRADDSNRWTSCLIKRWILKSLALQLARIRVPVGTLEGWEQIASTTLSFLNKRQIEGW